MSPVAPPQSPEAEESVVGQLLANPKLIGEVIGTQLEPHDFHSVAYRSLYHEVASSFYADEAIDPLIIGRLTAKSLARAWNCAEDAAVSRVQELARGRAGDSNAVEHARIVKRHADLRGLLDLAATLERGVGKGEQGPEDLAAFAAETATSIATGTVSAQAILSYDELGQAFERQQRLEMAARKAGIELGAYFGLHFIDHYTRGLRPTEMWILAGEPGAGKSAVAWKATQLFAERQMKKPTERRVGALVMSLEMGQEPSNVRLAQTTAGLDGGALREGRIEEEDLQRVMREWKARTGIPLYFNFASTLKAGQMRALIVESIRRYNVGLVVIDHMRYFDMDGRYATPIEEEEDKARFLKERVAKELNVAVLVLAHTTKGIESTEDRRPRLSHLRGSGQVAAHADFVSFVYRPYRHASAEAIRDGTVKRTDAEMIWEKNRHSMEGTAYFWFEPSTMTIR